MRAGQGRAGQSRRGKRCRPRRRPCPPGRTPRPCAAAGRSPSSSPAAAAPTPRRLPPPVTPPSSSRGRGRGRGSKSNEVGGPGCRVVGDLEESLEDLSIAGVQAARRRQVSIRRWGSHHFSYQAEVNEDEVPSCVACSSTEPIADRSRPCAFPAGREPHPQAACRC